ncbi:MAG: phosphate butyryltransferase [Tissierellia bacterium]|nr:phosphate butyryltransferase [Tissierellia bacterium]
MLRNFDELLELVKARPKKSVLGVVCAEDEHSIEAAMEGEKEGLVEAVLIGQEEVIKDLLAKLAPDWKGRIVHAESKEESSEKAVELVNAGEINALMKGSLDTSILLKAVVNKEKGLGTGRLMTHIALYEIPSYHKLLITTDGGMMMYPDLEQKKKIIENAVEVFHQLGYKQPKVACVGAVEKVNPKMPETVDAAELKEHFAGRDDLLVEGPISLDLSLSKEVAELKKYESPVAGDADIILLPNITSGNILGKSITILAKGEMAGIIYGAKAPIILTSRGSSAEEKLNSIGLASLIELGD